MEQTSEMTLPKVKHSFYTRFGKRFLDLLLSSIALVVLSPVFLLVSVLELIFQGSPVFYTQERPGLHGKIFQIYKFRSMTNETDENGELLPGYMRLTKFGKFIRKFSIDELPELFCIFMGTMSIVGPRPLRKEYLPLYNQRHMMRHEIRPGFACVRLKPGSTWTWRDQFENDLWYLEHCSLLVDIQMVFAVIREVLHPSKARIDATRPPFDGTNLDA